MAISKIDPAGLDIGQIGGRRNLIINGAMQVAQRGTSASVSDGSNEGYNTVDRFRTNFGSSIGGAATVSQVDISSDAVPFSTAYKLEVTTATTPSTTQFLNLEQRLEGNTLQQLMYGTSEAKTATLSFYVKTNKVGTYALSILSYDSGDAIDVLAKEFTVSSSGAWERVSIVIPPNTSADIRNNSSLGFDIQLCFSAGPSRAGLSDGVWSNYTTPRFINQPTNLLDTIGNYVQITGVQLEVGTVATPFEHISYGEQLALCQRYYQVIQVPRINSTSMCIALSASQVFVDLPLAVTPRELTTNDRGSGTLTKTGIVTVNGFPSNGDNISSIGYWQAYPNMLAIALNHSLTLTQYSAYPIRFGDADGQIVFTLDTEL